MVRMIVIATLFIGGAGTPALAGLMTDTSEFSEPTKVIDFSQFIGADTYSAGPIQVGDLIGESVIYTSNSPDAVIVGGASFGLDENGDWFGHDEPAYWGDSRSGFVGLNDETSAIHFHFEDGPVSSVGGFVNYAVPGYGNFSILALAADNSVLESYIVSSVAPISTPYAFNEGAFRGIARTTNDIYSFAIQGSFGVLDDLTFARAETAVVPEPSSMALFGISAVAGLIVKRRKQRAKITQSL